jgi:hypothetical protein
MAGDARDLMRAAACQGVSPPSRPRVLAGRGVAWANGDLPVAKGLPAGGEHPVQAARAERRRWQAQAFASPSPQTPRAGRAPVGAKTITSNSVWIRGKELRSESPLAPASHLRGRAGQVTQIAAVQTAAIDVGVTAHNMRAAWSQATFREQQMTKDWVEYDWPPHPRPRARVEILDAERRADGVYVTRDTKRVTEKTARLLFVVVGIGALIPWRFKLVVLLLAAWAFASIDHPLVVVAAIAFLAFVAVYQRRQGQSF